MDMPIAGSRPEVANGAEESASTRRALLRSELDTQSQQVAEHQETARSLTGQADVDSRLEREVALASATSAEQAIADIQHALARLEDGTYGHCEDCHEPIPVERLEVIPQARLCVRCSARGPGLRG